MSQRQGVSGAGGIIGLEGRFRGARERRSERLLHLRGRTWSVDPEGNRTGPARRPEGWRNV